MPNKENRDLKLDQFGISKYRYRELYNFCLQYAEFIKEKEECYSVSMNPPSGMPRGSSVSNPTACKAERAYILGKNIEMIEKTAIETCGSLYPWIIQAISKGKTWDELLPPCGKNEFYKTRRRFFYLLSLKK